MGLYLTAKNSHWTPYLKETFTALTCGDWVEKLERDYFAKRDRNPKTETTWRKNYYEVLKRLPVEEPLSIEILKNLLLTTKPDNRSRQNYTMVCNSLAKFANLQQFAFRPTTNKWIGAIATLWNLKGIVFFKANLV